MAHPHTGSRSVTRGACAGGRTIRSVDELTTYVDAWRDTADRLLVLLRGLPPADWQRETDCPGWRVRDVAAHLAHLEALLADGSPGEDIPGGREVPPSWTAVGVATRSGRHHDELVAELADAVARRTTSLEQDPPTDPRWPADAAPGGLDWDVATLLRNRAVDLWVHEQDVRRAVGEPGGLDSPGARVTVRTFVAALGYVLGKAVGAPPGTALGVDVRGPAPARVVLAVGADGRARPVDEVPPGCTWWRTDTETFCLLAAGRRPAADVQLDVDGDEALVRAVAERLAVTP